MKKIAIVLFVVSTALAACGKKKAPEAPAQPTEEAPPAEGAEGGEGGEGGGEDTPPAE
jgi:hypothetical protein